METFAIILCFAGSLFGIAEGVYDYIKLRRERSFKSFASSDQ